MSVQSRSGVSSVGRTAALALFVVTALLVAAPPVGAAEPQEPTAAPPVDTAPVVVDGVELFSLRGARSYPAETRASEVAGRIAEAARDRKLDLATLRAEPSELGLRLTIGDGSLTFLHVTQPDAELESVDPQVLATIWVSRVRTAMTTYREMRTREYLLRVSGWTLGATVLLILLLAGGRWLFRRLDAVILRRIETGVERLRIQSFRLLSAEKIWRLLQTLLRGLRVVTVLVLAYVYLNSTLSLFPWTRGFAIGMLDLVLGPLASIGSAILASIPDLVFLVVLAFVTRLVLRLIHLFFVEIEREVIRFESFDPDWAMPTYRLVRVLVIAFAVVVAFPYIPGSSTGAFKGVSLFAGVLFSLGSSSIISNVIAGYSMTYRRAFRDGDWIQVGDVIGEVAQTRLLVTHLRTPKNEEVVVPNSLILGTNVVNYSSAARTRGLVLHTTVGIGYETPWRQVEAMLLLAAERTEGLLREPPPFVHQTTLGDFAITYQLNAYCDAPQRMRRLYTEMHRNILDVFNEYGVAIMTPAYEADTPEPKVVPRDQWYAAPAKPPAPEA